jgi:hypothetical protein
VDGQPLRPVGAPGDTSELFDLFPELRGHRLEQALQSVMQSNLPQQLSPSLNPLAVPALSRPAPGAANASSKRCR